MKLHYADSSPFVWKVMVTAHECGLAHKLELLPTTPQTIIDDVRGENPLGQIPTLMTDDGQVLYDSMVIMEYFDHVSGSGLLPPPGPRRWDVLRNQAVGQGMITAINLRFNELRRPDGEQSLAWVRKKDLELVRVLDALEKTANSADLSDQPDLGTITIACALAYTNRRWPEGNWFKDHPTLVAWYQEFARRPSMLATLPDDLKS
jgi:glutathione S-transferase